MGVKRWLAAIGAMVLVMAVATPAWAQRGRGKKPPKTTCDVSEYPATVEFLLPEDLRGSSDWPDGPAIRPAGGNPTVLLDTTFVDGHVRSLLTNTNPAALQPLELDFSYLDDSHYTGDDVIQIDPRLTIFAYDAETLAFPECEMLGMVPLDADSYVGRTGFLWYDLNGVPVAYGSGSGDQQWILRHKPFDNAGNIPTHTKIVRLDANTWVLTSRTLVEGSNPAHFTSLQKTGTGKGKNAVPRSFSTPIMPVEIRLVVDCDLVETPGMVESCAVPTTGGS